MTQASERRELLDDIPMDVWLKRHWTDSEPNVASAERWISAALGAALAVAGTRQRPVVGAAMGVVGAALGLRALTGRCPVKAALTGENPARQYAKDHGWGGKAAFVHRAVSVGKPRQQVYAAWRDFSNLARWMENIERVEVRGPTSSHWVVKAPLGRTVEWDSVVTEDVPGERIAWETAPGADIKSSGWVEFSDAPGGRGTEVRARFAYKPPAGPLGRAFAKVLQREPNVQARRDLRRFKQWMETGEIAVSHVPGLPATPADLRL